MNLEDLIDALAALPPEWRLDSNYGGFHSYRGYYEQLALEAAGGDDGATVGTLLTEARAAVGATFEGWKGGEYVMDGSAPVWVSDEGSASGHRLVGLSIKGRVVGLLTEQEAW